MSAKHLQSRCSAAAFRSLHDELQASEDLCIEMNRAQMHGWWERWMPTPEGLAEELERLEERYEDALDWGIRFLLLDFIRSRGAALARALGRLRDRSHVALLELLESLERKPAPVLPPPLEAHSLSISAHGPPFGLAPKAIRAGFIT